LKRVKYTFKLQDKQEPTHYSNEKWGAPGRQALASQCLCAGIPP